MRKYILFLLLLPVLIQAQELDAKVTVNTEKLKNEYRDRLVNFGQQVEDYLNSNLFTGQPWQYPKIKCYFNIFFTTGSSDTKYSAQVVVVSYRGIAGSDKTSLMLSIMDNSWSFDYQPNQAFYFNQSAFDPITSFLDYYAYIIIGFDNESYEPFAGSDLFNAALNLTILGANSTYSDSWVIKSSGFNKRLLCEELFDANFQQFRQDFYDYHSNGIDQLAYSKSLDKFHSIIAHMIKNLEIAKKKVTRRSVLLNTFFEAKSGELINYLKDYPDKKIFDSLKTIDPTRITKYNEAAAAGE
ncbi:MAG: hypothetical protein Fur0015_01000 [Ignavibacteriales bacterium]